MLCYVDDENLRGITRKRRGRYWMYFDPGGKRIADRDEIDRLNGIGLPPAYEQCWFCPTPHGHIQAIGWDAKGRKQYRYHPDFRDQQEKIKYERMAAFGNALPKLRRRLAKDLAGKTTRRETVLAAVVALIDAEHLRVGNESYAKDNKSFGATTLRNRHARVKGRKLLLTYAGKHGIKRTIEVTDPRLVRVAKRTQDLPGQHLFEYLDEDGDACPVSSTDVNDYIRDAMGEAFTAKDFRTWGASVIAFEEMVRRAGKHGRLKLKSVIEPVAEALGNTAAISRKSYVHPALIEAAKDAGALGKRKLPRKTKYLTAAERGLTEFLEALPAEEAAAEAKVEARAKAGGTSRDRGAAEVAAEAAAGTGATA